MEVLTSDSLLEVLRTCDQYPGIEIGIACRSSESAKELAQLLYREIVDCRLSRWRIYHMSSMNFMHSGQFRLERIGNAFEDRSYIRIFDAEWPSDYKGMSFHKVLHEEGISEDAGICLAGCERLHNPAEEFVATEALVEFLESFKIV